jgi:tripartite-type tricarboxylate transporter receptor subunit TctC
MTHRPAPPRRAHLQALCAAAAAATLGDARAQAAPPWPERPVRLIVGYAAGGNVDQLVRLVAEHASAALGQPFVVENRTGASGTVAAVVQAPADGYTFLGGGDPELVLMPLTTTLPYQARTDLDPLCIAAVVPIVLAIHAGRPERTLDDVLQTARREPLDCAVPGVRTPMDLGALMMNHELGTRFVPVPYRGGGAIAQDLAGGQVATALASPLALDAMVKAGRVRLVAVCQREPSPLLPGLPAFGEARLRVYEPTALNVFSARPQVPAAIRERFASACRSALADPAIAGRLRAAGVDPVALDPDASRRRLARLAEESQQAVRTVGWVKS